MFILSFAASLKENACVPPSYASLLKESLLFCSDPVWWGSGCWWGKAAAALAVRSGGIMCF